MRLCDTNLFEDNAHNITHHIVIDPQLTRGDRLVGQVLGSKGSLPSIYTEIEINYFLLRRLLGVKTDDKKQTKVIIYASNLAC